MALPQPDREQFLAEPRVAALSVSAGTGRPPLTVPMWYQYAPGGKPWILTGLGSRKHRLIEAARCFSLMVERTEPTLRYVSVSGGVSDIAPGERRPAPRDGAALTWPRTSWRPIWPTRSPTGNRSVIIKRPDQWLSADLGAV